MRMQHLSRSVQLPCPPKLEERRGKRTSRDPATTDINHPLALETQRHGGGATRRHSLEMIVSVSPCLRGKKSLYSLNGNGIELQRTFASPFALRATGDKNAARYEFQPMKGAL